MTKKILSILVLLSIVLAMPALAGDEAMDAASDQDEVTAQDLGATEAEINNATEEEIVPTTQTGTLIEIGNTTAEETTVIVRVPDEQGTLEDRTLEIDTTNVDLENNQGDNSDLNDWIAGDQIRFEADENKNSGSIKARRVKNRSVRDEHRGKNGWITEIRPEQNQVDVTWRNKIYTLNLSNAHMVAGLKNPASIEDLQVGDRIRARVEDDGDSNDKTWDAKILVVLRRGKTLFMRVTRWVVYGKIAYIDEDAGIPTTITVEVLPSRFYQEGDVNNLVGGPGDTLEVYIDGGTKLRRRYNGKALISEFSEGDKIQIIGRLNEGTGNLDAKRIRNTSIQKLGVARRIGIVQSVDADLGEIVAKVRRTDNEWRILVDDETELLKQGQEITLSDIQPNDKIRVRGVANRIDKTIQAARVVVLKNRKEVKERLSQERDVKREEFKEFRTDKLKETEALRAHSDARARKLKKEVKELKRKNRDKLIKLRKNVQAERDE
jgi:hypothetical protein